MVIQASNISMNSSRAYQSSKSRSISMQLTKAGVAATAGKNADFLSGLASGGDGQEKNQEQTKSGSAVDGKQAEQQGGNVYQGWLSRYGSGNLWQNLKDKMADTATEEMTQSMTSEENSGVTTTQITSTQNASSAFSQALEDIRKSCIARLLEIFFGKDDVRYQDWMKKNGYGDGDTSNTVGQVSGNSFSTGIGSVPQTIQMTTFKMTAVETVQEYEKTDFSTTGTVVNADGTTIEFGLAVSMSRSFCQTYESTLTRAEIKMMDPLVINLDTNIAELSDQKFMFDIDSDGEEDSVSNLESGSGYLALDHNNDGIVNNGKELFGTESGNGFEDLAAYDEDGNGWIDEADSVFDKLKIWCKDENGEDLLYTLRDKNVGAICLQSAQTEFSVNSAVTNAVKGAIRSTGMFLYETGEAGTMQQLDLAT